MNEKEKDEPKIIVDDDWKSQVQAEKEQLQNEIENKEESLPEMPPASFSILLSTLGSQAMVSLGQLPDPLTSKPVINKPMAKHFIDTIGVLEEKTKGNLSEDEAALLTNLLHQLRMVFVQTPDEIPAADSDAENDQSKSSTIELP